MWSYMKTHIGSYVMTYVSKLFLWFVQGFSDVEAFSILSRMSHTQHI
ncbi:hypothetical protein F383_13047 [Gossypium arboreum]|uniref:Uncharacterized protein n=1 Tax=Gossypium arboreum TaxID=29729 RepID=A0A0B0Q0B1_GOSAR|nr:hypothetical protein F383_13047 [Gossypium arboreum]